MVIVAISLAAMLLGIFAPAAIFSRVLFAWTALGSAFGPVLLLELAGREIRTSAVVASIATGFVGTLLAHWYFATAPGDWVERLMPFGLALGMAWLGRVKASKNH